MQAAPATWEIKVAGRLGTRTLAAFEDLKPRMEEGGTVLCGRLADQSALYGLLNKIQSLGLELIEVRRLPSA